MQLTILDLSPELLLHYKKRRLSHNVSKHSGDITTQTFPFERCKQRVIHSATHGLKAWYVLKLNYRFFTHTIMAGV
jgi:hypothetical protein